jgi:hypothetical protein
VIECIHTHPPQTPPPPLLLLLLLLHVSVYTSALTVRVSQAGTSDRGSSACYEGPCAKGPLNAGEKNFDSEVLGSGKNAFVKFLAPW